MDGKYAWGDGNVIENAVASVVVIKTDAGISGCGEFTPCGENYMIAHSQGVEAIARIVADKLIGLDPRQVGLVEWTMDKNIQGHGYAKAPFDAACWDILGKATEQPVWMLLGGKLTDGAPMYRVAPQKENVKETVKELNEYRKQGYGQFQIKVGNQWEKDIEKIKHIVPLMKNNERIMADANQGWRVDDAIRIANETKGLDYIFEQPCQTYEECMQVRQYVSQPMKLDECINSMYMAQRIIAERSAEICCLKISNLGGLSKAKKIRDMLVENKMPIVCEDTWGGQIATATVAHFAASTPEKYLVNSTDLMNYNTKSTGIGGAYVKHGKLYATDTPGLGVEPDFNTLKEPVAIYGEKNENY